jgi:hypothetical protein
VKEQSNRLQADIHVRFLETGSHGYLEVPVSYLIQYQILTFISPFSYISEGMAYLEEDIDKHLFIFAVQAVGKSLLITNAGEHQDVIMEYQEYPYTDPEHSEERDSVMRHLERLADANFPNGPEYFDSEADLP